MSRARRRLLVSAAAAIAAALSTPTAANATMAAGTLKGTISFEAGYGVRPLFVPCGPSRFSFSGRARGLDLKVPPGYLAPIDITGSGAGDCEGFAAGGGNISLEFGCFQFVGAYARTGLNLAATLAGACTGSLSKQRATFTLNAELIPRAGDGISTPIVEARFVGEFTMLPA